MIGVQCIGKKAVLSRFETLNTDTWAIYQGKQFIVSGSGADDLGAWIDCFADAGSTATYMLRVYDGDEKITSSTGNNDYLGCIGFKAVDQYDGQGIAGHNNKLMERIGALEKQLREQDDENDESDTDLNSIIMGWLTDPVKLNQVAGAVRTMFGTGQPAAAAAIPLQTISGIKQDEQGADPVVRISAALDILEKYDPDLVVHLEKLAKLAQNDTPIFKAVTSKLDAL